MTGASDRAVAEQVDVPDMRESADQAWYLYGIIRTPQPHRKQNGSDESGVTQTLGTPTLESGPLKLVEHGDLAAVVRPVSRDEFTEQALQERLRDPVALEEMARAHNQVIATIHDQQAILPARLGSVYAQLEDVRMALEPVLDALRAQLDRLEGCDEWAVHVYADPAVVQRRVAAEEPSIRQLQEDLDTARPGRAYFLQRKLSTSLAAATDRALDELAAAAYERLMQLAVAGQIGRSARSAQGDKPEVELLRAAFLVPRTSADVFLRAVDSLAPDQAGARAECSGPWPPYSFAPEEQL